LAIGLAQQTPQVTLRHLEHQALSLADCQTIALEMREGEAILAEADGARKRLRTLLALDDAPATGARTVADTGTSPTTSSTPRQHTTRVGERTPMRDPVGVAGCMGEAHTP
jgi:hypothetical protein